MTISAPKARQRLCIFLVLLALAGVSFAADPPEEWQRVFGRASQGLERASAAGGDVTKALQDAEAALDIARGLPDGSVQVTRSLIVLGKLYVLRGDGNAAVKRLSEAIGLAAKIDGENSRPVGMLKQTLASAYWMVGKPEQARSEFESAVSVFRSISDFESLPTALCNLAGDYLVQGEAKGGLRLIEEAASIQREHPPSSSANVILLAELKSEGLYLSGRYRDALDFLTPYEQRAFESGLAVPEGRTRGRRGLLLAALGEYDLAMEALDDTMAIRENALGSESPYLLEYLIGKAEMLVELGRRDGARELVSGARPALQRLGRGSLVGKLLLLPLNARLAETDEEEREVRLQLEAAASRRRELRVGLSCDALDVEIELARLLAEEDPKRAASGLSAVLSEAKEREGECHPLVARGRGLLGRILLAAGEEKAGVEALRGSATAYERSEAKSTLSAANVYVDYGEALLRRENFEDALSWLARGLRIWRKWLPRTDSRLRSALDMAIQAAKATNRPDLVVKWESWRKEGD